MSGFATNYPLTSQPAPTTVRPPQPGDPVITVRNAEEGTTRVPVSLSPKKHRQSNWIPGGICIKSSDRPSLVSLDKKFRLFVKTDGDVVVMGPNGHKVWSLRKHHRRDAMIKADKAPFRLCLKNDGVLAQFNAKHEVVWSSDTQNKGVAPFKLHLGDRLGILSVIDARNLVIWSSGFPSTCDEARSAYLRMYKDVAKAGIDPWQHYKISVLAKPADKKEKRVWLGPSCQTCDGAKKHYHVVYPDAKHMDAAEHYLKIGRKEGREWKSRFKCLHTIQSNQYLEMGNSLISMNGKYRLLNQADGNLVSYSTETKKIRWSLKNNGTTNHGSQGATYRLRLREDGNLVYITAKGELIWHSDSAGKANPPFEARLLDDGNLGVFGNTKDGKGVILVWSSMWPKTCELARQQYLRLNKEVAKANIDPWVHYSEHVLRKPKGEKEAFVWPGPKCVTDCERARVAYHKLYPEVSVHDAGWHYAERGRRLNRTWQGHGKDIYRCVNSVISPGYIHSTITSENGIYKATLARSGIVVVTSELGVVWQHTKHTSRRPGKGPYSLQLQNDGNLVARNADGSIYWDTNSANMGYPPFTLTVTNMGHLRIRDERGVIVWSTGDGWHPTCAGAQAQYKKENGGTWDDYLDSLLQKPHEKRVWRGPRCNQCSDAYARYVVEYPEVKNSTMNAAEHFVKIGKYQHRLWTGFDDCWKPPQNIIVTRKPQTTTTKPPQAKPMTTPPPPAKTTQPPTPKPTTTVIDGKIYNLCMNPENAVIPDEWGRKWGSENGDTCVIYTNKGT